MPVLKNMRLNWMLKLGKTPTLKLDNLRNGGTLVSIDFCIRLANPMPSPFCFGNFKSYNDNVHCHHGALAELYPPVY